MSDRIKSPGNCVVAVDTARYYPGQMDTVYSMIREDHGIAEAECITTVLSVACRLRVPITVNLGGNEYSVVSAEEDSEEASE